MDCTSKYSANDIIKLIERNEKAKATNTKNYEKFRAVMSDDEFKALKSNYNKTFRERKKLKQLSQE